ncbi:MAG: c-type cytochrome [bacterium]
MIILSATGLLTLLGFSGAAAQAAAQSANAPTWHEDVAPIVAENCVDCHQPEGKNMGGMVAPFSMMSYEEARPWARMMAHMVETRQMPPWHAHPVHRGTFEQERFLEEADIRTVVRWAEAGATEGDPANSTVEFALNEQEHEGEWWIGEPDLVMAFAEPYHVEDHIEDLNVNVNVQVPDSHTEAKWIKASEMHGGAHVHHICGEPFGCIAPGWDPYVYPDGFAKLLPPVEEISLGMHYNKKPGPGTEFRDDSKAAVIFYEPGDTIRHFVHRSVLSVGEDFVIPAGHPYYSLTREFEFEEDSYILSLTPHMHYLGRAAKYELEHPDGRRELLLWVPDYHFEWQRMYVFKDPPVAPAGSTLLWTPVWDNSEFNEANPDPTSDTPYGLPTYHEMGNGWLDYTPVEPINHVVGEDEIPEDLLNEVTEQLESRANREQRRFEEGELADPSEGAPSEGGSDDG